MKIKRLTAMLLTATIMAVSSIPTYAKNFFDTNNAIWGENSNYVNLGDSVTTDGDNIFDSLQPDIQTLRISLIKTGTDTDAERGMPATNTEVKGLVNNPITMAPSNVGWVDDKSDDYMADKLYVPWNDSADRKTKGLSPYNSRREYLATSMEDASEERLLVFKGVKGADGAYISDGDYFGIEKIASNNSLFTDPTIPNIVQIPGGQHQAEYQTNPPEGALWTSSSSVSEYFDLMVKSSWVDPITSDTTPRQVFIYHIAAKMLGKSTTDPSMKFDVI